MRAITKWALVGSLTMAGAAVARCDEPTASPPRGARAFESLVPPDSLLFVTCPHAATAAKQFEQTQLFALWMEPEVQAFLHEIVLKFEAQGKGMNSELHLPDDPVDRFKIGQIALSVGGGDTTAESTSSIAIGIQVGANLDEFRTLVGSCSELAGQYLASVTGSGRGVFENREHAGVSVRSMPIRGKDLELCYTFVDSMFIGALNRGYLEKILDTAADPKKPSLAQDPVFRHVRRTVESGVTEILGFLNVAAIRSRFEKLIPAAVMQVLRVLGLDLIQGIAFSETIEGKAIRDTLYVYAPGERRGFLKLLSPPRNPLATLRLAPRDAFYVASITSNWAEVLDSSLALTRSLDPGGFNELSSRLRALDGVLGFRLKDDLLATMDGEIGMFIVLPSAGSIFPEIGLAATLKDPAATNRCLVALPLAKFGLPVKTVDYGGGPISYLDLSSRSIPLSPAFCVSEKFLLAGGSLQTVKQMAARLASKDEGLLGHADYKALRARLPQEVSGIEFVDLKRGAAFLASSIAPMLGPVIKQKGIPIDPLLFPSPETLGKHLSGMLQVYRSDAEGITLQAESPVGSGLLLACLGTGIANIWLGGHGSPDIDEIFDSPMGGAAMPPRERAVRDRMAGRFDAAVRHLTRAIENSPNDGSLYFERGAAYHSLKDYARARADFDSAASRGHFPEICQFWIARTFALSGDPDAALQSLQAAIEKGYGRRSDWANEPDFESLRNDPRFRALVSSR